MPQSTVIWLGIIAAIFLGIAFLVPAGYGLPGPVFGVIFLLLAVPGLLVGGGVYRRYVKRGDVDRLGGAQDHPDPEQAVKVPNATEAEEQVNSFRRASGEREVEVRSDGVRERSREPAG